MHGLYIVKRVHIIKVYYTQTCTDIHLHLYRLLLYNYEYVILSACSLIIQLYNIHDDKLHIPILAFSLLEASQLSSPAKAEWAEDEILDS